MQQPAHLFNYRMGVCLSRFIAIAVMILLQLLLAGAQGIAIAQGISTGAIRNVEDFYSAQSPTSGIQEAIDALPPGGGLVILPPGVYLLKRSIIVPGNTALRGSGPSTILKKCPGIQTKMIETTPQGSRTVKVEDVKGFEPGMQICIRCREIGGWHSSQPVINTIEGNTLFLSEALEKEYDVRTSIVINCFPAIWVKFSENISIQDLSIDGGIDNTKDTFNDFVCSAIHTEKSSNITVRGCHVQKWPSDGISIQGGTNAIVTECTVSGCRGHGFHPGTSIRHAVFSNIIAHHNAYDGLYFCADVNFISVTNGIFYQNGWSGIGGLGGGTWPDRNNIVTNNVCESNGRCGIQGTEGTNFLISNNICRNNSQSSPAEFPGILLRNCTEMIVTGNLCYDDQADGKKTQKCGIEESLKSNNNVITSNNCWGNLEGNLIINGVNTVAENNRINCQ